MCGSVILKMGGGMRRLNIDVCVSREGLVVMGMCWAACAVLTELNGIARRGSWLIRGC
jgi:hypothetical protein